MYIHVYIYTCIFIYIHTHANLYTHTYIHTSITHRRRAPQHAIVRAIIRTQLQQRRYCDKPTIAREQLHFVTLAAQLMLALGIKH